MEAMGEMIDVSESNGRYDKCLKAVEDMFHVSESNGDMTHV